MYAAAWFKRAGWPAATEVAASSPASSPAWPPRSATSWTRTDGWSCAAARTPGPVRMPGVEEQPLRDWCWKLALSSWSWSSRS